MTRAAWPRRSADAVQVVKDCQASVVAARLALVRAERILQEAAAQVDSSEAFLAKLRKRNPRRPA